MEITLSDGTTTIDLPPDLLWSDEFWSPVSQAAEYSLAGALVVEQGVMLAGRPITLTGDDRHAWIERETLTGLMVFATMPNQTFTLAMHSQEYRVMFRLHDAPAVEAEPVDIGLVIPMPIGQKYRNLTIKLMVVS